MFVRYWRRVRICSMAKKKMARKQAAKAAGKAERVPAKKLAPKLSHKVQLIELDKILPYAGNPLKHSSAQVEKLAAMIHEYGWDQPIVVDGDGVIIKGHGRFAAAKKLGLKKAPVIVRDDLSPAQVKAARIADNRSRSIEWDDDLLTAELEQLEELNFDLDLTGFEDTELAEILDQPLPEDFEERLRDETVKLEVSETKLMIGEFSAMIPARKYEAWLKQLNAAGMYTKDEVVSHVLEQLGLS